MVARLLIFFALAAACAASDNVWIATNDVLDSEHAALSGADNSSRLTLHVVQGGAPVDLSASTNLLTVSDTRDGQIEDTVLATDVDAAGGIIRFSLDALDAGTYTIAATATPYSDPDAAFTIARHLLTITTEVAESSCPDVTVEIGSATYQTGVTSTGGTLSVENQDGTNFNLDVVSGIYATGTPIYAESDPVWESEKSGYATGTPLYAYAETDPVWESEKSNYATGTPLYVYTETDPLFTNSPASGITTGNVANWQTAYEMGYGAWETDKVNFAKNAAVIETWDFAPTGTWYDAGGGVWTNVFGWWHNASNAASGISIDTNTFIYSPLLTNGLYDFSVAGSSADALAGVLPEFSTNGTDYSLFPGFDYYSVPQCYIRFSKAEGIDKAATYTITNISLLGYAPSDYLQATNDQRGTLTLVGQSTHDDAPVRYLDWSYQNSLIWQAMNTSAAYNAGANLAGNELIYGTRWSAQEAGEALNYSYFGSTVWTLYSGGTVLVTMAATAYDETNVTMRVVCSQLMSPTPQWSTNLAEAWNTYTNFSTTWPHLTNGCADLTFEQILSDDLVYYRAACIGGTNSEPGYANLTVPLNVEDLIEGPGVIGSTGIAVRAAAGAALNWFTTDGTNLFFNNSTGGVAQITGL